MAILVVGNATLDLSFEVAHLPRPGETLLARARMDDIGGKGFNQAIVARRAGARVCLVAVVGDDQGGAQIRNRVSAENLSSDDILVRPGPSDVSIICVAPGGENCIVSSDAMAKSLSVADVAGRLTALSPSDLLLTQGNLGRATTAACIARARERGARVMLNPAPIAFDYTGLWSGVDVAVVNEVECATLSGEVEPARGAERLLAAGVRIVVATLGAGGALIVRPEGRLTVAAPRVEAVDTSGAGDVFCGVLAAGLDHGLDIAAAVAWGVRAASLSVTRRGTGGAFPSAAELEALRDDGD